MLHKSVAPCIRFSHDRWLGRNLLIMQRILALLWRTTNVWTIGAMIIQPRQGAAAVALEMPYRKAKRRIPQACQAIEDAMAGIHSIEEAALGESDGSRVSEGCLAGGAVNLDAAANRFGILLGSLFAYKDDFWATDLRRFGARLGKFVYVMDAVMDLRQDQETGSYNPFLLLIVRSKTFVKTWSFLLQLQPMRLSVCLWNVMCMCCAACCIPEYGNATNAEESKVEHG